MMNLFAVPANATLYIPFCSYDSAGASVSLGGSPAVGDIAIYKNGSVVQRSSTAGYSVIDTDFDGVTGLNVLSIDLSNNTDSGFYAAGSQYFVVVSGLDIEGNTVNTVVACFRIVAAESVAGKPKVDVDAWLGTAAATPTTAGVPEVDVTFAAGTAVQAASGRFQVDAELGEGSDFTDAVGDAVLDEVVEGSTTLRQMIRGFAAALLGKASGLGTTTAVYRDIGDTKDRISATVDADGNRTAVTRDLT
jgi:hypothetical protein